MEPAPPGATEERKAVLVGQILRGELTPQEVCRREGLSELELKRWVRAYTRAARRAVDEHVAAALAAHGLEVDERPFTELTGSLDGMGLSEVIQTVQYGKKDAHVLLEHDGEQSQLWCMQGDVVDATSAKLTGSAAVYRILGIQSGRLHAAFSPVQRNRTIHASTQALLMEAAKRVDECQQIRQRLGDTQNIYVPSASAPPESEIEPDQASVLRAFDGTRSIEQVVHDSDFPDLETLGMIMRLFEQQWLVLEPFRHQKRLPRRTERLTVSSFEPLATSLASRFSGSPPRSRLWASAAAGVAVVAGAFAIGFYSARPNGDSATAVASLPAPTCGAHLVPLPGGQCLERSAVTTGEYLACVRAGACEPLHREPPARSAAPVPPGADVPSTTVPAATSDPAPPTPRDLNAGATASKGEPPTDPSASGRASTTDSTAANGAAAGGAAASGTSAGGGTAPGSGASAVGGTAPGSDTGASASASTPAVSPSGAPTTQPAAVPPPAPARHELAAQCNAAIPGREGHPVNCVTAPQARRYCEWRGGRLPTRTEWELAAAPGGPLGGVIDLLGGLSEWTIEPPSTAESNRERYMVLGGGLDATPANPGGLSRRHMNANVQGRGVTFRCAVPAGAIARL